MSRVFISHSSVNNAAALALASWLDAKGWSDYFLDIDDGRGIAPGERWMAALAGAVDRCEAVIFLVSPAWRDSKFCFAEFYQAKNLGKRIFGVIVEPIPLSQLPEQMTAEWQVCDLTVARDPVSFSVARLPFVPVTAVSFLRAGLLPRLRRDSEHFIVLPPMRPERAAISGSQGLLNSLKLALVAAGQAMSPAQVRAELASVGLAGVLRQIAPAAQPANGQNRLAEPTLIVPIDQAEELFGSDGQDEALQFLSYIDALRTHLSPTGLPSAGGGRLRVLFVLTIRSDSLPKLQAQAALQALSPVLFSLPAMPVSECAARSPLSAARICLRP